VRTHIRSALEPLDVGRFRQEPAYVNALLGRLIGVAYEGDDALVKLDCTSVTAIGRGAAEGWSGADFAVTATIREGSREIKKAILAQAKLGSIDELTATEADRLQAQLKKMRLVTRSPKVLVVPLRNGRREPRVLSGRQLLRGVVGKGHSLADYFVARVLTTLDGDTRPSFVASVSDGRLPDLHVTAEMRDALLTEIVPSRRRVLA
jgi:hypothetical protein